MKSFISSLFLALLLASCGQERDVKKLRQAYRETTYNIDVINSLPLYDSLKNIIISNIDTIFKFRNSRHFVFHTYANGDTATVQEDEYFYQFYYNYGEETALSYGTGPNDQKLIDAVSLENMPKFIYPSVDNIFKKLGKGKIVGFTLWADSTLEISVESFRKGSIEVSHTLTWKTILFKNTNPDDFYRDTLIAPKWTYGIWLDEHQGR